MAVRLPNGAIISIAATYGAAKTMSALTNATEAVATLAASHGVIAGDILELTSGWSRLNGRIARAKTVSTNDVTLEGINSTSTALFEAGSGTGSVREVASWVQLSQVSEFSSSGGDQQFTSYAFLEDDKERQIPTQKSAESLSISLGDDQSLPWYSVLDEADLSRTPRALKVQLPSGAIIYYNAYVSFNKTPTMTKNQIMVLKANFSMVGDPTRYAS